VLRARGASYRLDARNSPAKWLQVLPLAQIEEVHSIAPEGRRTVTRRICATVPTESQCCG